MLFETFRKILEIFRKNKNKKDFEKFHFGKSTILRPIADGFRKIKIKISENRRFFGTEMKFSDAIINDITCVS